MGFVCPHYCSKQENLKQSKQGTNIFKCRNGQVANVFNGLHVTWTKRSAKS